MLCSGVRPLLRRPYYMPRTQSAQTHAMVRPFEPTRGRQGGNERKVRILLPTPVAKLQFVFLRCPAAAAGVDGLQFQSSGRTVYRLHCRLENGTPKLE